ncbi:MAG: sensor histidine kinase [Anaerolinea sp.]|nr:sensor histidine kinase [Anaerolinea sp.]
MSTPKQPTFNATIRNGTFLFILVTVGLSGLAISIAATLLVSASERAAWDARISSVSETTNIAVFESVERAQNVLTLMTEILEIEGTDPSGEVPELVDAVLEETETFVQFVILDAEREVLLNMGEALLDLDALPEFETLPVYTSVERGDQYFADVFASEDGIPNLLLVQSLEDGGYVAGVLEFEVIVQPVPSLTFGSTGALELLNTSGELLAAPEGAPSILGTDAFTTILNQPNYAWSGEYVTAGGVTMRAISRELPGTDMFTVTQVASWETSTDTIRALVISLLIDLVLAVVFSVFMFVSTAQQILQPLEKMKAGYKRLQAGELTYRVEVTSSNEMGEVAYNFNEMAQALQDQQENLRAARDEARAAQRVAIENDRLKSEFLATMSHELRTPLNAIEGFSSIMLNNMGIQLPPQPKGMVERISANSKRLVGLIDNFLDLSRIEAGRLELVEAPFSPTQLAEKWRSQYSVLAEKKGLTFDVEIDPNLPPTLVGDDEAITKVAINLLGNAIKFTSKGGVSLRLKVAAGEWLIEVTDTGVGIPPQAREYIFDEFRQVDSSSSRVFGGSGLGLAIAQKLTRAMGGTINLESEVNKGSVFTVHLPLRTVAVPA